jgi:molybdenum cofactor cytidylyltransferase
MSVPAIILAAGASRRLGRPKQLVMVSGETLLGRTVRLAREAGADPVIVVLGAHVAEIAASADLGRASVIVNAQWEQGIASTIHVGIEMAWEMRSQAAMLLVCDQPRLTAAHLRELTQAYAEAGVGTIVASRYAGTTGIPAIFPAEYFERLLALAGDEGARRILREDEAREDESRVIAIDFEGGEVDVDSAEHLEQLAEELPEARIEE